VKKVLRAKFIAMSAYIKELGRPQINNIMIHFMVLEKQEQSNPKIRSKEVISQEGHRRDGSLKR
jgi:hypothetical protein